MASAVTLTNATPGDLIDVKGVVLEGVDIQPRTQQTKITKFWGVNGESEIWGGHGGRDITIPVIIYDDAEEDADFETARALADYLDYTLSTTALGANGTLDIVSAADHSAFTDCTFRGVQFMPGETIKQDVAGTLGGGYYALCLLFVRQLASGAAEIPPGP